MNVPPRALLFLRSGVLAFALWLARPALADNLVATSTRLEAPSGRYAYLFIQPAPGKPHFSISSVTLENSGGGAVEVYDRNRLLDVVDTTLKGTTYPLYKNSGASDSGVRGLGGKNDAVLVLRIPLPAESTGLQFRTRGFEDDKTGAIFSLGDAPELSEAHPIQTATDTLDEPSHTRTLVFALPDSPRK